MRKVILVVFAQFAFVALVQAQATVPVNFEGRVMYSTGEAAAGVTVTMTKTVIGGTSTQTTATGGGGNYFFESDRNQFQCSVSWEFKAVSSDIVDDEPLPPSGVAASSGCLEGTITVGDLSIPRPHLITLAGHVSDQTGRTQHGLTVTMTRTKANLVPPVVTTATTETDDKGRYQFMVYSRCSVAAEFKASLDGVVFEGGASNSGCVLSDYLEIDFPIDMGSASQNAGKTPCNGSIPRPVNVSNGNMYLHQTDYHLPGVGEALGITRTYNSISTIVGLFGRGWTTEYDETIAIGAHNRLQLTMPDGRLITFATPDFFGEMVQNPDGSFTVTFKDGRVHQFNSAGKLLSQTDRKGNQTTLVYGPGGNLASVTDPFGRMLSLNTNANGQVLSISDSMGTIASYTYGLNQELLSVTYADNSRFQFAYTPELWLSTVTDALGNIVEHHEYDAQGRATTSETHGGVEKYTLNYVSLSETDVTDALGQVTKYFYGNVRGRRVVTRVEGNCNCGNSQVQAWTYDDHSNVTSKTDALSHNTTYTYDGNGNRLSETDAVGTASYTYDQFGAVLLHTDQLNGVTANTYDASGALLTTRDPLNNTTTFTHNTRGQLLTATDARGKASTFTYDAVGNLTQSRDANNITTFHFYDARSRLTKVRDGLSRSTLYGYDLAGRLNKVTHPDLSFVGFTYDLAGRRTIVTDERGNPTNYAYDNANRLTSVTDALGHPTTYGYDAMSNLTSMTDALNRVTNYEYDDFDRLKKTTYPPAISGGTRLFGGGTRLFETLAYDAVGNVTQRTDTAGRVTNYAYDNVNRLASTTDADNKITGFEYDALSRTTAVVDALNQRYQFAHDAVGRQTQMTRAGVSLNRVYDAVGNVTQRTDYNGVITNYFYDNLNRLTSINYPTRTATYAYDPLNNLTRATNENGSVYIGYDNRYRVSSFSDPFYYGVSYNYDTAGNRTKLKLNGATYATYTYDAVNRLTNLADSANLNFPHTYDVVNRLTSRSAPSGVASTYVYDGLNRLTALNHLAGATTLIGNQYTYNDANNISSWTNASGNHAYGYDSVDRLTSAANSVQANESYGHDGVGNRTASHLSASYGYQPFNKLTSTATATYAYDNNGNLLSKTDSSGTTAFTWNEENQLTQVALPAGLTVSYKYDGLGRRIQRSTNAGANERYVYDGHDVLLDLNADWTVATKYFSDLGIDNKLRQTSSTTGVSYYLADHVGSTSGLLDANGSMVEQLTYDAFGKSGGSARTRYGYTGRERDPDTSLMHYRARSYDPAVGRFISEDPAEFAGGRNWYAYVSNAPTNATDPFGLWETDAHEAIIDQAFANCLTEPQLQQLKDASEWVDRVPNQGEANAYQHGMSVFWQDKEIATNAAYKFIRDHRAAARKAAPSGCTEKIPSDALREFGIALHTLTDMTSPSHQGFQPWHDPVPPPFLAAWTIFAANHHSDETLGDLGRDSIRLQTIKKMARFEFAKTFGDCGCCVD